MLTSLSLASSYSFQSLRQAQQSTNLTAGQTLAQPLATVQESSLSLNSGFTADAANGQLSLNGQSQWTPEDFYTGLPQDLMQEYAAVTKAERTDWQTLAKDVASGDLQSAQKDLATYEQLQPGGGGSAQDAVFAKLSAALASGDQALSTATLQTASASLSNQLIDGGGALPMLLAQAANDAMQTSNWVQELTDFGGNVAPATMGQPVSGSDAFTQDLSAIELQVTAGTQGLANFLKSQGYGSDLATADAQMVAYKWTVDSLSAVVHDVSAQIGDGAAFEISSSVSSVGSAGGELRAYTLSTDEAFSNHLGIKNTVTASELALTDSGAVATAAVDSFDSPRPYSATAAVTVDRSAAAAVLSSMSGYQTSFSVTEVRNSVAAASVSQSTTATTVSASTNGSGHSALSARTTSNDAWAAVAVYEHTVDAYSAGKSSYSLAGAQPGSSIQFDSSYSVGYHEATTLIETLFGSSTRSSQFSAAV